MVKALWAERSDSMMLQLVAEAASINKIGLQVILISTVLRNLWL